ncbi:MAG: histidine phosphatase family protein [Pseudomonadota bacterium]
MKRLTILRHANSDLGMDDFERPLNRRGEAAAHRVGEKFGARKLEFDLVLASPAKRVRETLDRVAETCGALPVRFEEALYLAPELTLLESIRAAPDEAESLLLVGHNPGLERLIVDLALDDGGGLRARVIGGFPTAAVAILDVPVDRWNEVASARATIAELLVPRALD